MHHGVQFDVRLNAEGRKVLHFPLMFISDIHLGTKHSRARKTSHALEHTDSDHLYLDGDIFDIAGRKRWKFAQWHRQVVGHIVRRAAVLGRVTYVPGNHDIDIRNRWKVIGGIAQRYRSLCGKTILGVAVEEFAECRTPDGRLLKVIHSDQMDPSLARLSSLGNLALEFMANVDTVVQKLPRCSHISPAAWGKHRVKEWVEKRWRIREAIAQHIDSDPRFDGIVTGHSHISDLGRTPAGKLHLNDGSCTEHVEFGVIDAHGKEALIEWHYSFLKITEESLEKGRRTLRTREVSFKSLGLDVPEDPHFFVDSAMDKADRALRLIYRLWTPRDRQKAVKKARFAAASSEVFAAVATIPLTNPHRVIRLAARSQTQQSSQAVALLSISKEGPTASLPTPEGVACYDEAKSETGILLFRRWRRSQERGHGLERNTVPEVPAVGGRAGQSARSARPN